MSDLVSKKRIQEEKIQASLQVLGNGSLREGARDFLSTLGYTSEKRIDLSPNTADAFLDTFDPNKQLNPSRALLNQWRSVDLLFQLTDDEITQATQGQLAFTSGQVDDTIIESYLFLPLS